MVQHALADYDPTARTGADLQAIFDAFQSGHIGTSRPSYATKGTIWFKEIGDPFTSIQEYLYDGSGDRLLREYFATGRIRTYFSNDGDQWIEADPSGNDLIIGAGNSARFQFTNDGDLIPETDDASDIGSATKRIKDIFLSGGLFLGGTNSWNKIDIFERGSFTPVFRGMTTDPVITAYGSQKGRYVRIDNDVFGFFHVSSNGITSYGSGSLRVGGLPFDAGSLTYVSGPIGFSSGFTAGYNPDSLLVVPGTDEINVYHKPSSGANGADIATTRMGTNASIYGAFMYRTDS